MSTYTLPLLSSMQPALLAETVIDLAAWMIVHTEQGTGQVEGWKSSPKVVVGAAIIAGGRVLACARSAPPEAAGKWEFPGGKVEAGESDEAALIRECAEELAVRIEVGERIGPDVRIGRGRSVLRVYAARLLGDGPPRALEHAELRWLSADELSSVPWLPADVPIVEMLPPWLDL
jgi:8-oxo-dGTP diphosphatase